MATVIEVIEESSAGRESGFRGADGPHRTFHVEVDANPVKHKGNRPEFVIQEFDQVGDVAVVAGSSYPYLGYPGFVATRFKITKAFNETNFLVRVLYEKEREMVSRDMASSTGAATIACGKLRTTIQTCEDEERNLTADELEAWRRRFGGGENSGARQGGWATVNEIRAMENLNPIEGGEEVYVPMNMGDHVPPKKPSADRYAKDRQQWRDRHMGGTDFSSWIEWIKAVRHAESSRPHRQSASGEWSIIAAFAMVWVGVWALNELREWLF